MVKSQLNCAIQFQLQFPVTINYSPPTVVSRLQFKLQSNYRFFHPGVSVIDVPVPSEGRRPTRRQPNVRGCSAGLPVYPTLEPCKSFYRTLPYPTASRAVRLVGTPTICRCFVVLLPPPSSNTIKFVSCFMYMNIKVQARETTTTQTPGRNRKKRGRSGGMMFIA